MFGHAARLETDNDAVWQIFPVARQGNGGPQEAAGPLTTQVIRMEAGKLADQFPHAAGDGGKASPIRVDGEGVEARFSGSQRQPRLYLVVLASWGLTCRNSRKIKAWR